MPTYAELLTNPKWKEKRLEILNRDRNKCAYCNNKKLFTEVVVGKFVVDEVNGFQYDPYHKEYKAFSKDIDSKQSHFATIPYPQLDLKKQYIAYYHTFKNGSHLVVMLRDSPVIMPSFRDVKIDVSVTGTDWKTAWLAERRSLTQKILSVDENWSELSWVFSLGLNVHHLCYRVGRNPWEYENKDLITACLLCHKDIHMKGQVPVYDENGVQLGNYTICHRCHGVGWFPEYFHVQSGICFRCGGAMYEELLEL